MSKFGLIFCSFLKSRFVGGAFICHSFRNNHHTAKIRGHYKKKLIHTPLPRYGGTTGFHLLQVQNRFKPTCFFEKNFNRERWTIAIKLQCIQKRHFILYLGYKNLKALKMSLSCPKKPQKGYHFANPQIFFYSHAFPKFVLPPFRARNFKANKKIIKI